MSEQPITKEELSARLAALSVDLPTEEQLEAFYHLSQEAQDAIVWAVTSPEDDKHPGLSDDVKVEILAWAIIIRMNERANQ